jgi:hypothetical protein
MSCGIDLGLNLVKSLTGGLVTQVKGLINTGAGALATNINALKSLANTQLNTIANSILSSLPLPTSLLPAASLISDMTALIALANNPAAFASQITNIIKTYGNIPGVDIQGLATDILSGKINLDNVCSLVPNVEKLITGEIVKKGIIPVPPTLPVLKLPEPPELPKIETVLAGAKIDLEAGLADLFGEDDDLQGE